MVKTHQAEKYWIRFNCGLVDSIYMRSYCRWFNEPKLGAVISVSCFYKSKDTDIRLPMESFVVFAAICTNLTKWRFNDITSGVYSKNKIDRGSRDAFELIARSHQLMCVYRDKWSGDAILQEAGVYLEADDWDGDSVDGIPKAEIEALVDSFNKAEEWHPSPEHASWNGLTLPH